MKRYTLFFAIALTTCTLTAIVLWQMVIAGAKTEATAEPVENENAAPVSLTEYPEDPYELILSLEEVELFASYVMAECGNTEPDEGVCAVAECLRNAMLRDRLSVSAAARKYQYTGIMKPTIRVRSICLAVLYHGLRVLDDEEALWFYAPAYGPSEFHDSRKLVASIGGHNFYK